MLLDITDLKEVSTRLRELEETHQVAHANDSSRLPTELINIAAALTKRCAELEASTQELDESLEDTTAENEALELEVQISRKTIQRFLDGEAPTVCDQCHEKLYSSCGVLMCAACRRGWDPREDEWLWTEYKR